MHHGSRESIRALSVPGGCQHVHGREPGRATYITYIPLQEGFLHLVAIVELFSMNLLSWKLYNSLDTEFFLDSEHDVIRCFAVTPANTHDSQMLPMLLCPENQDDCLWADFAYSGQRFEDLLSLGAFESRIHEKGSLNHPLSEATKECNSFKSAIHACVEHVYACITTSMGGKLTRKIGLERNEAWWDLKS